MLLPLAAVVLGVIFALIFVARRYAQVGLAVARAQIRAQMAPVPRERPIMMPPPPPVRRRVRWTLPPSSAGEESPGVGERLRDAADGASSS